MKKLVSIILAVCLLCTALAPYAFCQKEVVRYDIVNPYAGVDWDSWRGYKTQLHCHTTASDGYQTIHEAIADYYALDYDIVAITDHGTTNLGWDTVPQTIPIVREIKKERTGGANAPIIPLTAEEYAAYTSGTADSIEYTFGEGDGAFSTGRVRTHGNGMLDVEKGNELNMATPFCDCHLTCYWSGYGQGYAGVFGDYETPCREVNKDGGMTMLAHVGEYVYPDKDSAKYVGQPIDEYYVNKFARIFLDNPGSTVGMGVNSATDAHTRCDRILYDSILKKTIPNGVTPWAFTFSDSHDAKSLNFAYTVMYMPELTQQALRDSMTNGSFFSVSHYSNGCELNGMKEMAEYTEPREDEIEFWLDDTPVVTRVEVDDERDVIKVWGENFDYITWVSDGNVILRDYDCSDGYAELDLNSAELLDDVHMFVRFYLSGKNGICYAQPMVVRAEGEEFEPVDVPETHDLSTFLRGLVTVLDWLVFKFSPVVWAFKYFALGYDPIEQAADSIEAVFK
ncbi:MAG: hypothetical protein K6C36_04280 [Clostridia bacterium]|nr:hypothetical protein [Clostridia bacterium]